MFTAQVPYYGFGQAYLTFSIVILLMLIDNYILIYFCYALQSCNIRFIQTLHLLEVKDNQECRHFGIHLILSYIKCNIIHH